MIAGAVADGDHRHVGQLEPALGQQHLERVGDRRARRADADLEARQVLGRMVVRLERRLHPEHEAEPILRQEHDRQVDALGLHEDGVLVGADDGIDAAADQRLERLGAALELVDREIETFVAEIALALGERERQVGDERTAGDADRQRFRPRRRRAEYQRRQRHQRPRPHAASSAIIGRPMMKKLAPSSVASASTATPGGRKK
jgi:hypothetical protein